MLTAVLRRVWRGRTPPQLHAYSSRSGINFYPTVVCSSSHRSPTLLQGGQGRGQGNKSQRTSTVTSQRQPYEYRLCRSLPELRRGQIIRIIIAAYLLTLTHSREHFVVSNEMEARIATIAVPLAYTHTLPHPPSLALPTHSPRTLTH